MIKVFHQTTSPSLGKSKHSNSIFRGIQYLAYPVSTIACIPAMACDLGENVKSIRLPSNSMPLYASVQFENEPPQICNIRKNKSSVLVGKCGSREYIFDDIGPVYVYDQIGQQVPIRNRNGKTESSCEWMSNYPDYMSYSKLQYPNDWRNGADALMDIATISATAEILGRIKINYVFKYPTRVIVSIPYKL